MAGNAAGGIPWNHATPRHVPPPGPDLGKIYIRRPLWPVEPPKRGGNGRIQPDSRRNDLPVKILPRIARTSAITFSG
jgi:hypothetical protein